MNFDRLMLMRDTRGKTSPHPTNIYKTTSTSKMIPPSKSHLKSVSYKIVKSRQNFDKYFAANYRDAKSRQSQHTAQ